MKRLLAFLLVTTACAGTVRAQLSVQLRAEKEFYLLYESIPLAVSLHNNSGRTVQIDGTADQSWLTFRVNDQKGTSVPMLARVNTDQSLLIPAGQTVNRTVDIVPLYELRSRGSYSVQVSINGSGVQAFSVPVKFNITEGRELSKQVVGLATSESGNDEYRAYTLLAYRTAKNDRLYVSVKDDPPKVVYGVIPLGVFLEIYEPQTAIDRDSHLHLIYQNGPRSFGYVEVDTRGKVIHRAAYSDYTSRPQLRKTEGLVTVTGGEQTWPKQERILTEAELNPPPPPPPPKKKKSWWSFGSGDKAQEFGELPATDKKR